ncbi:beta-lactamase family protein [Flavobacteriaceae bacterium]|nr:beta-lactamase family protein [Flavobacteriaceae bacterium]MDA9338761.1 beta-lactamase family protein [Flavobacteriaceae bacterium]
MKKLILLIFLITSCNSNIEKNRILEFQKNLVKTEQAASNVAMVFKENKIVYNNIFNSEKEGDKEITDNTIFPIWSMSKPITITAVMTLLEKGLIDLDDDVSKYIPAFNTLNCKNSNGEIYQCENQLKLIHLMTHRSGYGYYGNPQWFTSTVKYNNLVDFVNDVAKHPVEFEPGSDYLYGLNMAILGRVIEVVTEKTFYEYLKETVFDPLEMNETKFYLTKDERQRFQPLFINSNSLLGFTNYLDEMSYDIDNRAYFGGEGLVSTMSDYANFCKMLLNRGTYNGNKIISSASIDMMTSKYSVGKPNEFASIGDPFYYGFSLFVLDDIELDGTNSSKGIYGWSGYHNTHFWIDDEKQLFGLFMTRAREFSFDLQKEFRRAVYSTF